MNKKLLGLIPINYKNIDNNYKKDLDNCNITSIFISNKYNLFTVKKKKEHKLKENILESFNSVFKSNLNDENTKIIEYGWLENIYIYLLLVDNSDHISKDSLYNITNNNTEQFCWIVFLDRYKCNNSNIYKNIIYNNSICNNHLDFEIKLNNYRIKILDIYEKISNLDI